MYTTLFHMTNTTILEIKRQIQKNPNMLFNYISSVGGEEMKRNRKNF